ncbi:DUF2269 family protein [Chitinilyticum litopenaei]|uniref:DUF2269 family protein n=1 Tax=Chitinilyticum litopenaei TaxID=1121276 RepID=UPI000410DBD7|nr:DUF2269 family protein [Chitinilyticum litopenaei]
MLFVKTLHVLGAVLFLGNIIVSAFWKTLADRDGRLPVLRFATRLVNVTDLVFTAGGAVLLTVCGHLLAGQYGGVAAQGWIWQAYAWFGLSGLIWLAVLLPVQIRQSRLLAALPDDAAVPEAYWRLSRLWMIAGTLATFAPLPALWLMIARGA